MAARLGRGGSWWRRRLGLRLAAPLAALALVPTAVALLQVRRPLASDDAKVELPLHNPLELEGALVLAGLITGLALVVRVADHWLGSGGVYAVAALSGVADVDALGLSVAQASRGSMELQVAATAVVLAAAVNTAVKVGMAAGIGGSALARACGPPSGCCSPLAGQTLARDQAAPGPRDVRGRGAASPSARICPATSRRPRPTPTSRAPAPRRGDEVVQTHLSWVFLTARRVVKVRKSVRPGFLDFGTTALRNADCLREVRLNRRLAPDVYLGVAPLLRGPSGWALGPVGEELAAAAGGSAPEHAVVMRRLPAGGDALSLLEAGALTPAHLDAVAAVLAAFHARSGLGRPAPFEPRAWREALAGPMAANLASLAEAPGGEGALRAARDRVEAALRGASRRLRGAPRGAPRGGPRRRRARRRPPPARLVRGRSRDAGARSTASSSARACAGSTPPARSRSSRWTSRIAAARDLAARFLRRYAEAADDFGLYGVVDLYAAYRAAVRAKVAGPRDAGTRRSRRPQRAAAAESARGISR